MPRLIASNTDVMFLHNAGAATRTGTTVFIGPTTAKKFTGRE